tara:strand:+ start:396 stop:626 length:231 start_codon:yes stop_codon:yes gene_type:complete
MCFGRPKPPKLPDPEPVDSPIEETAAEVVVGDKRKTPSKRRRQMASPVTRRRFGTRSLQIPLLTGTTASGNLNYTN